MKLLQILIRQLFVSSLPCFSASSLFPKVDFQPPFDFPTNLLSFIQTYLYDFGQVFILLPLLLLSELIKLHKLIHLLFVVLLSLLFPFPVFFCQFVVSAAELCLLGFDLRQITLFGEIPLLLHLLTLMFKHLLLVLNIFKSLFLGLLLLFQPCFQTSLSFLLHFLLKLVDFFQPYPILLLGCQFLLEFDFGPLDS